LRDADINHAAALSYLPLLFLAKKTGLIEETRQNLWSISGQMRGCLFPVKRWTRFRTRANVTMIRGLDQVFRFYFERTYYA
jgi:hypothetical protein